MSARSRSQGSPEPSASSSASSNSADRRRDARELVAADAEPEQGVGAVDVGELRPLGKLARPLEQRERLAHVAALGERPALAGERAQLELGRASRHDLRARRRETPRLPRRAGVPPRAPRPARASPRSRLRSSTETPCARKLGSTPSRPASHASVSCVGRVFPRSIWLTYSFEKRSPASSVCVRPGGEAERAQRARPRRMQARRQRRWWQQVAHSLAPSQPMASTPRTPPEGGSSQ